MARKPKRNVKRLIVYEKALEYADLKGGETVIDAYCGTGTISLCLAKKAKRVIGIEIVKPAIEDAKKNAKKNHMENTEFYSADAGKLMPQLYQQGLVPDVIVMDPVRAGCSGEVLKASGRHESPTHCLRFLQYRHFCERCEDFKIGRLRNQRSSAGGHVPPDHACGDSLSAVKRKRIKAPQMD